MAALDDTHDTPVADPVPSSLHEVLPFVWHDLILRTVMGTEDADASVDAPSDARLISSCSFELLT